MRSATLRVAHLCGNLQGKLGMLCWSEGCELSPEGTKTAFCASGPPATLAQGHHGPLIAVAHPGP